MPIELIFVDANPTRAINFPYDDLWEEVFFTTQRETDEGRIDVIHYYYKRILGSVLGAAVGLAIACVLEL